jgi:protein BUR2
MTSAEIQHSSRVNGFLPTDATTSDDPTNVHSFAQRSATSSTSPVAQKRESQTGRIPPPAPSPPPLASRRSPPVSHAPFNNTMATTNMEPQSQWLFTEEEIHSSPSIRDGLSVAEEISRRAKGVNFIIQAGILLKIPQLTLGTASVFFHRFYMRYSMVPEKGGIHHYVRSSLPRSKSFHDLKGSLTSPSLEQNIAATALFLATKAEENCRKTKEIVIAVVKVAQKNASLIIDEQSKEFWRWKDSILLYEETMLELLTFDVVLESPYTCLFNLLKELQIEQNKAMRNVAWAFLNDSCMTTLCLLMPPRDIAIASLYFAAKFNGERLPDDQDGKPWWTHLRGVPAKIVKAIDVMADFYTDNPLKKNDNPYDRSPGSSTEDLDRTRLRHESRSPMGERAEKMELDEEHEMSQVANGKVDEASTQNEGNHEGEGMDTEPGDDDTKLKAIANDPATHELSHQNGTNGFQSQPENGRTQSPKRRNEDVEAGDEQPAKRMKMENEREESEEGEVEE